MILMSVKRTRIPMSTRNLCNGNRTTTRISLPSIRGETVIVIRSRLIPFCREQRVYFRPICPLSRFIRIGLTRIERSGDNGCIRLRDFRVIPCFGLLHKESEARIVVGLGIRSRIDDGVNGTGARIRRYQRIAPLLFKRQDIKQRLGFCVRVRERSCGISINQRDSIFIDSAGYSTPRRGIIDTL